MTPAQELRPAQDGDLPALLDLWVATWRISRPDIDFEARRGWFVEHLAQLVAGGAQLVVALGAGRPAGFVVVDPATGYIDQIAVAPEAMGGGVARRLLDHAKALCPAGLSLRVNQLNTRAIRFYEREGFQRNGTDVNSRGEPLWRYAWTPPSSPN